MKEKLKSKVVWITVIPLIAQIIAMFTLPEYAERFSQLGMTIVSVLAVFGILNNPNDKENF